MNVVQGQSTVPHEKSKSMPYDEDDFEPTNSAESTTDKEPSTEPDGYDVPGGKGHGKGHGQDHRP